MKSSNPVSPESQREQLVVRSNGRIHFGLMEISDSQPNCYGGIGLMVDYSIATVQAIIGKSANSQCIILADSHWGPRVHSVTQQWLQTREVLPIQAITVIDSPFPHQGLGSGTQIACTIASILFAAETNLDGQWNEQDGLCKLVSMDSLSLLSQRGKRSHIGLTGFLEGGFVVDHGRTSPSAPDAVPSSRTERYTFPDWPVILIQDMACAGDSGVEEAAMFERCKHQPNSNRESMIHLVQFEILPALQAVDWMRMNEALGEYGRFAGGIFEPVQGGIYRTSKIANTIEVAKQLGLVGATQSSWGPTVCAFGQDDEHASWCQSRLRDKLPHAEITVTKAANTPAQLSRS